MHDTDERIADGSAFQSHGGTIDGGDEGLKGWIHRHFTWAALVGIGGLTMISGMGVMIALMSPENLRTVPTVALVCVLVLLCVPVPVLMLERSHRKARLEHRRAAMEEAIANIERMEEEALRQHALKLEQDAQQQDSKQETTSHSEEPIIVHVSKELVEGGSHLFDQQGVVVGVGERASQGVSAGVEVRR